jgi:hypothetical protein
MNEFPNFHDGFVDGILAEGEKAVRLFLRTNDQKRFTLILGGVEAMKFENVRAGNIILDVAMVRAESLTLSHIRDAYDVAPSDAQQGLLTSARERGLLGVEVSSSYGAEGIALAGSAEIKPEFRLGD